MTEFQICVLFSLSDPGIETISARISAAIYLWPLQVGQYEDRECRLLIGDGFYLHLAEDPIYATN